PDYRWFLTAWITWEGAGPPYLDPNVPGPPRIDADTILFRIAWMPKPPSPGVPGAAPEPDLERPIFLRSRVDARDRRRIAAALHAPPAPQASADSGVIQLDDILKAPE